MLSEVIPYIIDLPSLHLTLMSCLVAEIRLPAHHCSEVIYTDMLQYYIFTFFMTTNSV